MVSERIQRRIERLLDEAEHALDAGDWAKAESLARGVLDLDPDNQDALTFADVARLRLAEPAGNPTPRSAEAERGREAAVSESPTAFADGRYLVRRFLGEGGKKRVYLAHDTLLDRDVAFALIKTEGLDAAGRDRITREAQAMGRLGSHPHIVSVFDLGEEPPLLAGGQDSVAGPREHELLRQPFIVTELMGGGDVEGLIENAPEHRLTLDTGLRIGIEVCRGLEFAHDHGIVHRDLKPGNVWLTEDGTAKLGDFGLAVALDKSRLTQAGMMVGTVSYMPPEQATGGEVTARSDLYSLGAMLYEMVTGRPPFVGDEAVAIIGQHLNTPPVAPSWHRPDCPPGLEALVLGLLEKNPTKRPQNASDTREALDHVRAGLKPAPTDTDDRNVGAGLRSTRPDQEGEEAGAALDNPLYRRVFVGREHELKQLQSALDVALAGKGALAMVVGEPGIGKTAVCEQLVTYATLRGGTTLTGHCYEEGSLSLPYLAFVEAVRGYAQSRPSEELRKELGAAASDLARIVSEVREQLHVEPRPPGDPEEDRWRLLQAVSGFLRNASMVQPLLLVLEDLHWADQGTLDLLVHLARNLQGARLLVVGTYRDVEVDRSHPLSAALAELRRGAEFGRVQLRGLGTPEVQRMLEAITGGPVPGSLAESIHRQTEGNPLFVQEVVRYLVEEGHLGHGQGAAALSSIAIPEGLRDVIGRRLSRLSPDCNRVLAVAAVIGRDFGLGTLQTVVELNEEQVVSSLEEALKIGVLEEQSRPGSIRYRFAHAFFRQTLYEELIAPRRLRLHQQVAAALENQYKNRLEEHAAELAEHFAQSTDPAELTKAVRYGELGAQRALTVYAYGEAARHLEQALAVQEVLDPDDAAKRCDLLLALGEALISTGEGTQARENVAPEAVRLAQILGDHHRVSEACWIVLRSYLGNLPAYSSVDFVAWARLADENAQEGTFDRIHANLFLSAAAAGRGDGREVMRLQRSATELALRLEDSGGLAAGSVPLLQATATPPEEQGERLAIAEKISMHSLEGVRAANLADLRFHIGTVYLTWGRREDAEESWGRAKEAATRSRDAMTAFVPLQIDALVATIDGSFNRVLQIADETKRRGAEIDRERAGLQLGTRAARRALIYLGRADEALAGILNPADLFMNNGVFAAQRALCLAHAGSTEAARDILHRMMSARDMGGHADPTPASVLRYLLETAVILSEVDAAKIIERRMASMATLLFTEADMCYNIGRLCGGAAALQGQAEKARGYYNQALEICQRVRFRPEIALTRLELAELLLKHYPGERAAVVEHLDFAIAEFREMKMQPSLERALRHKDVLKA